jgi:hypothetical protein
VNDFNFYGQAGVGIDILALFIETGYNYGFTDVFKMHSQTHNRFFLISVLGFNLIVV